MMEEAAEIKGARDFIEKAVRPSLEQGIPFVVVVHEGTESKYFTKGAVDQTFVGTLATHCVKHLGTNISIALIDVRNPANVSVVAWFGLGAGHALPAAFFLFDARGTPITPADLAGGRESSEVIMEWSKEVLERMSVPKTPMR